jgi:aminoglycoside phosphotransferase (APT) family kinase protein
MTHNDMLGVHIFLTKNNRIAGIIDFGDKAIGDPAKDFNGLFDIDPSLVKSVYAHYNKKDPTLLDRALLLRKRGSLSWLAYNAKAGTPKSYARAYRQFKRVMKLEL